MTFGVPLGPGIEDVTVHRTALTDEGASFEWMSQDTARISPLPSRACF